MMNPFWDGSSMEPLKWTWSWLSQNRNDMERAYSKASRGNQKNATARAYPKASNQR